MLSNVRANVALLQEGVRVHAKVTSKSGIVRFLPGRIIKVTRNSTTSSSNNNNNNNSKSSNSNYNYNTATSSTSLTFYDIECEGLDQILHSLTADELIIGLHAGTTVEAKRPSKINLQCTSISWNSTGNMLAVSYGKIDILGWCKNPGAICCWSIFNKKFNSNIPDMIIDHPSCLMCVKYHPTIPSLLIAGSYHGEIILWDLTNIEQPLAISEIIDYSHKEPIRELQWIYNQITPSSSSSATTMHDKLSTLNSWLINSISSDGRILFWSYSINKLKYPVKGYTLATNSSRSSSSSSSSKSSSSRLKGYPSSHGASSIAYAYSLDNNNNQIFKKPKWVLIGQEGGGVLKIQGNRVLNTQNIITKEILHTLPNINDIYPSLKTKQLDSNSNNYDSNTHHIHQQIHIGCINNISCSIFHRNLYLTCGNDGLIKLFHILEQKPLRIWEPCFNPIDTNNHYNQQKHITTTTVNETNDKNIFSPITSCKFSPIRPLLFGATSSDGFLYLYDLHYNNGILPIVTLECLLHPPLPTSTTRTSSPTPNTTDDRKTSSASSSSNVSNAKKKSSTNSNNNNNRSRSSGLQQRVTITDFAFNHKQRELIAACDYLG